MATLEELKARVEASRRGPQTPLEAAQPVQSMPTPTPPPEVVPQTPETSPQVVKGPSLEDLRAKVEGARAKADETLITENTPWMEVLREGFSNIPESAMELGRGVVEMGKNPLPTVKAIGDLMFGVIDAVMPDPTQAPEVEGGPGQYREDLIASRKRRADTIDLVTSHYKNRYGSLEGFKKAVAKDPVGVAADVATVLVPGGAAVKGAGEASGMAKIARLGEMAQKAGTVLDPVQIAKQVTAAPFRLIPKSLPETMYQRAVKFSTTLKPEVRQKLTRLALDEKIAPTDRGLDKVRGQINLLANKIEGLVDARTRTGERIPIKELFRDFDKLRAEAATGGGVPALRQISNVKKNLVELNRNTITPTQAQAIKQKVYKDLAGAYEKMRTSTATVGARKAVARAAKEILESSIPELKSLNASEGVRIKLAKELDRITGRLGNNNIINLPTLTGAGAGGVAAGVPGAAVATAIGVLGRNKAKIALILEELRKANPQWKPSQALIDLGVIEAGQIGATTEQGQ